VSAVPNQVLSVSQCDAVRLLGVERTTTWRMCGRGDLLRVRMGRRTLITWSRSTPSSRHRSRAFETNNAADLAASSVRSAVDVGGDHNRRMASLRLTTCIGTPFSSAVVAYVWRRVCTPICDSPARLAAIVVVRSRLRGSTVGRRRYVLRVVGALSGCGSHVEETW
jgi:hypothetical protein